AKTGLGEQQRKVVIGPGRVTGEIERYNIVSSALGRRKERAEQRKHRIRWQAWVEARNHLILQLIGKEGPHRGNRIAGGGQIGQVRVAISGTSDSNKVPPSNASGGGAAPPRRLRRRGGDARRDAHCLDRFSLQGSTVDRQATGVERDASSSGQCQPEGSPVK